MEAGRPNYERKYIAAKWTVYKDRPAPPGPRKNAIWFTFLPRFARATQAWQKVNAGRIAQKVLWYIFMVRSMASSSTGSSKHLLIPIQMLWKGDLESSMYIGAPFES